MLQFNANGFSFLFLLVVLPLAKMAPSSYYYPSQNAAGYDGALSECKANLGDTASLVSIETPEKHKHLTEFLGSSDSTGSSYWTGGKYDDASGKFVWANGKEIDASCWDVGHPKIRTPDTGVLAYTVGKLVLRTDFQTVSYRYICELIA